MSGYKLILADPPWSYSNKASNGAADNHYGTMKFADLLKLPVSNLAADDAVLAMWYTGNFNAEAMGLARAWGFTVKTMKGLTWVKLNQLAEKHINKALSVGSVTDYASLMALLNQQTRIGLGNYTRSNSEDLLIAIRGKGIPRVDAGVKQVIYAPLDKHSKKPVESYRRLERLYGDVKRIELFARSAQPGWDVIGDGIDKRDIREVLAESPANDNQMKNCSVLTHYAHNIATGR